MTTRTIKPTEPLDVHHVAAQWPSLPKHELELLIDDVKANGVQEPITLTQDGELIDGRHRWHAAQATNQSVLARTVFINSDDEAWAFCTRCNDRRRNSSSAQRAIVAARDPRFDVNTENRGNRDETKLDMLGLAAEAHNTNRNYVAKARMIVAESDDLAESVLHGEASIETAALQAKAMREEREASERKQEPSQQKPESEQMPWEKQTEKKASDKKPKPEPKQDKPADDDITPRITREQWDEITRWYNAMIKRVEEVRKAIAAYQGGKAHTLPHQYIDGRLNQVVTQLKHGSRPFALCPACRGRGSNDLDKKCEDCCGQGWLSRSQYDRTPENLRKYTRKEPART